MSEQRKKIDKKNKKNCKEIAKSARARGEKESKNIFCVLNY